MSSRGGRKSRIVLCFVVVSLTIGFTPVPTDAAKRKQDKLTEARNRYRSLQEQLNRLAKDYAAQQQKLDSLQGKISSTSRSMKKASSEVDQLEKRLRLRVRAAYRLGGVGFFDFLLSSESFRDFSLRAMMLERQAADDEDLILELRRLRADLATKEKSLKGQKQSQSKLVGSIRAKAGELDAVFGDAQALVARLEGERAAQNLVRSGRKGGGGGGSGRAIALARCPAGGPNAFSNDWGAPRGGGKRRHKGNDIFAPMGSPATAVVPGVITRESSGGNGGLSSYLWGDDGNEYFYAHLSGFAVPTGRRVSAGQAIGYVGNTGNARGGAAHIHFEIHPGGGAAINPYYSLIRVC